MHLHDIEINDDELAAFCQRNGVRELLFFGSIVRDTFHADSDIDVYVRLEPNAAPTLIAFARLQDELTTLIGRQVHLHTDEMIPPNHRDYFLRGAQRGYAA